MGQTFSFEESKATKTTTNGRTVETKRKHGFGTPTLLPLTKHRHHRRASSKSSSRSSSSKSGRHTHKRRGFISQMRHELHRLSDKNVDRKIMDGGIVTGFYKKLNGGVMYHGRHVDTGMTSSGFKELGNRWAKDNFNVYYAGDKVKGVNSVGFKLLGGKYAGDMSSVYYGDKKTKMQAIGFKYLGNGYAKDSFGKIYKKGEPTGKTNMPGM